MRCYARRIEPHPRRQSSTVAASHGRRSRSPVVIAFAPGRRSSSLRAPSRRSSSLRRRIRACAKVELPLPPTAAAYAPVRRSSSLRAPGRRSSSLCRRPPPPMHSCGGRAPSANVTSVPGQRSCSLRRLLRTWKGGGGAQLRERGNARKEDKDMSH